MDTWYIYGVSGALLERGRDGARRNEVVAEIGELVLGVLGSNYDRVRGMVDDGQLGAEVRLFCDLDDDELATYVWSGGRLQELCAISDIDLRETLDLLEREIISRWKRSNPGYDWTPANE